MKDNNSKNNDNKNMLETNNGKQNTNSYTNVSTGEGIHSRNTDKSKTTISKNKNINLDKSKNTVRNINNNNNTIIYKFSNNKKDKELKKIERPGLQDIGIGKIITFEAVLVGKYRNRDACYTVMNLHQGRKYLADHTQLLLNEEPEEFIKRNTTDSKLIRATGRIDSYGNPNNIKYCINLLPLPKKIIFLPDIYYDNNELYDSSTKEFKNQMNQCYDKIDCARHDDLLYMIENLRYKINNLTEGTFVNDFIYHFIINQYSLNTLNSDMYNNTIQSDEFDDEDLRNLIVLLGGVLYDLLSNTEIKLYDLLTYSAYRLNKIQNICNLNCNKKESLKLNMYFTDFCKKHNIRFGKGWEFVKCRNKIFNIDINSYSGFNEIEEALKGICYSIM
jgi:hypothetical protein